MNRQRSGHHLNCGAHLTHRRLGKPPERTEIGVVPDVN